MEDVSVSAAASSSSSSGRQISPKLRQQLAAAAAAREAQEQEQAHLIGNPQQQIQATGSQYLSASAASASPNRKPKGTPRRGKRTTMA